MLSEYPQYSFLGDNKQLNMDQGLAKLDISLCRLIIDKYSDISQQQIELLAHCLLLGMRPKGLYRGANTEIKNRAKVVIISNQQSFSKCLVFNG